MYILPRLNDFSPTVSDLPFFHTPYQPYQSYPAFLTRVCYLQSNVVTLHAPTPSIPETLYNTHTWRIFIPINYPSLHERPNF